MRHETPMRSLDSLMDEADVRRFYERCARELGRDVDTAGGRAQVRRPLGRAGVRERRACGRLDPRRRRRRRGRHREHQDHPRGAAAPAGGAATATARPRGGARRGLHPDQAVRGLQPPPRGGGREDLRQSAQHGGRQPAHARRQDHGVAAAADLLLGAGAELERAARHPVGVPAVDEELGPPDQRARHAPRRPRRRHRLVRARSAPTATRSPTRSTAASSRWTRSPIRSSSASSRTARAGRWRGSSRRASARRASSRSRRWSDAPARSRRWRRSSRSSSPASPSPT